MIGPLTLEQALSARDALAKAIYGRTFTWLVQKINQSLAFQVRFPAKCGLLAFYSLSNQIIHYLTKGYTRSKHVFICQNTLKQAASRRTAEEL